MKREKFRHRFAAAMLCLVMSMVSYPAQPVLAEDDYQFRFYTNADVGIVRVTGCTGYGDSATIPDQCDVNTSWGYRKWHVTELSPYVFSDCCYLKTVTITIDQSMKIDTDTFSECPSLEEIKTTRSSYYDSQDGILYDSGMETLIRCPEGKKGEVSLPSGVVEISPRGFYSCQKMTDIIFPKSLSIIGYSAFDSCNGLEAVSIPEGVEEIGSGAFSNCENLACVSIPKSVSVMGYDSFENCPALKDIYFACTREEAAQIQMENSATLGEYYGDDITERIQNALGLDSGISLHFEVDFSEYSYRALEDKTVEITGYEGSSCYVAIPSWLDGKRVVSIGDRAFAGSGLQSVSVPDGVTTIGIDAFYGCSSLEYISIPGSLSSIWTDAFYGCGGLKGISYAGSPGEWDRITVFSGNTSLENAELSCNCDPHDYDLTILEENEAVVRAYHGAEAAVSIPGNADGIPVTGIGEHVFSGMENIRSVEIPATVRSIGKNAFFQCSGIEDVYFHGSRRQWRMMAVAAGNEVLGTAEIHYSDDTEEVLGTYVVTFDGRGVASYAAQTVEEYGFARNPGEPPRAGYVFAGWYLGDRKWDFEYDKVEGNMTLTAVWETEEKVVYKYGEMYDTAGNRIIPLGKEFILDSKGDIAYDKYIGTTWKSSNLSVVSISSSSGRSITIEGVGEGTAVVESVTVSEYWIVPPYGNSLVKWDVDTTITKRPYRVVSYLTDIKIPETEIKLVTGESAPLNFTTVPEGNYSRTLSQLRFSSSDPNVVTVSEDGILTAKNSGTATIRVYATNG